MTLTDKDALTRAIALCRAEDEGRAQQIDSMLASEPWERVATFAAYCSQTRTLRLEPWEFPPLWIRDIDAALNAPDDARRFPDAARLLWKMRALEISRFEADPLTAIAEAEKRNSFTGAPLRS